MFFVETRFQRGWAMRCPYCKSNKDKVIDSRSSADGFVVRRRRVCKVCGRRFTTYERVEQSGLRVIKKDGSRVPFDRDRLLQGILKACEKRAIALERIEEIVERVERQCIEAFDKEVSSRVIGELVMEELKALDHVAYVRFASVYREFRDVSQFKDFIDSLRGSKEGDNEEKREEKTKT